MTVHEKTDCKSSLLQVNIVGNNTRSRIRHQFWVTEKGLNQVQIWIQFSSDQVLIWSQSKCLDQHILEEKSNNVTGRKTGNTDRYELNHKNNNKDKKSNGFIANQVIYFCFSLECHFLLISFHDFRERLRGRQNIRKQIKDYSLKVVNTKVRFII